MSPRLRASWLAALTVVIAALAIGTFGDRGPQTQAERVYEIAAGVRCPECVGQTAAESDTASARAMRTVIAEGLQEGRSEAAIVDRLVASYGEDIVLEPTSEGVTGLVWMIPVVVGVIAVAGLVVVFRRWSRPAARSASTADEVLVAEALATRHAEGDG